jgi:hypothetical protein
MAAFILSSAVAFALYELLALTSWPRIASPVDRAGVHLTFNPQTGRVISNLVRAALVIAILLFVLFLHEVASPLDVIESYQVKIVFGFLFGPLLAIWVNSVVFHPPTKPLTRGQIVAAVALALLFLLGMVGNETAVVLSQYARNLSSLKFGGAELSFATKDHGDREARGSTQIAGSERAEGNNVTLLSGSSGLQYLTKFEDSVIKRDEDYVTKLFEPDLSNAPLPLDDAKNFAHLVIAPPLSCLFDWLQQTADEGPVDRYLRAFGDALRQLSELNRSDPSANSLSPDDAQRDDVRPDNVRRLDEIDQTLNRNMLAIAVDVAASTPGRSLERKSGCGQLLVRICPQNWSANLDRPDTGMPACLRRALDQANAVSGAYPAALPDLAGPALRSFAQNQEEFKAQPYHAIILASVMAQLGQYASAAAILDGWIHSQLKLKEEEFLHDRKEYPTSPRRAEEDWLTLRARSFFAVYVEEWLQRDGKRAPILAQNQHLENLQAIRAGFKSRLLKAHFFRELDEACKEGCVPVFKRPGECPVAEGASPKFSLWRSLYTSYVSMEFTYIDRALRHPDYATKYAELVNDEASRLADYDMSCGARHPKPETIYAQSLLGFARSAVQYDGVRASIDSEDERMKRLNTAERAVRFALETLNTTEDDTAPSVTDPYLQRIGTNFAAEIHEQLELELKEIKHAKSALTD